MHTDTTTTDLLTADTAELLDAPVEGAGEPSAAAPQPRRRNRRDRRGMTLVEILIVLTILAGIMVTVGVVAINQLDKAKIKESKLRLNKISGKIQEFYAFQEPGRLPDDLNDLVDPPGGEPSYLKKEDIKDAWGNDVSYSKSSDRNFELRSPGPDGQDGSDDDITVEE